MQRPSALRFALVAGASLLLAVAAVAGCGGSDQKTLDDSALPFTFEYPSTFTIGKPTGDTSGKVLALVGLDRLNIVAVREAADSESSPKRIRDLSIESLRRSGVEVTGSAVETHSGLQMVVLDVSNEVTNTSTTSELYFFPVKGKTWEIECQSTGAKKMQVDEACKMATDSIKPR